MLNAEVHSRVIKQENNKYFISGKDGPSCIESISYPNKMHSIKICTNKRQTIDMKRDLEGGKRKTSHKVLKFDVEE